MINIQRLRSEYNLGSKTLECLKLGYSRALKSLDPHHGSNHIERMLADLENLRKHRTFENVNWEVVVLSIVWHDLWRATQVQPKNIFKFILSELYDGIGGRKLFLTESQKLGLDSVLAKKVAECILKHSTLYNRVPRNIEPHVSEELKILRDLDELDSWNLGRLHDLTKSYLDNLNGKAFDKRYILIGKMWYYLFMKNASPKRLYYSWSKEEFNKRKKLMIKEVHKLWKKRSLYGVS